LTIPPSESSRASRAALAARLTELRTAAGLSGNALAKRIGALQARTYVQSRVWKIENGTLLPGEDDIRAWVTATGHGDAGGLLAMLEEARSEQAFGTAFRRKGGAVAFEERVRAAEERAGRIGEFQVAVIPGILQTADYARELMSVPSGLAAWGAEDQIEGKVSARLRRQEALYDHSKRVQVVLGEGALRTLVCAPGTLAAQLEKLLAVMSLPSVELGIIAFPQRLPAYPLGFRVYDDDLVVVESTVSENDYTAQDDPGKVAAFLKAFEALREAAATGDEARRLITAAAADLRERG